VDANAILSLLTSAELTLWLLALAAAIYAKMHKSFVAVICFISSKLLVAATYSYISLHYPVGTPASARAYGYYWDVYWLMYLVGTVAVFFSIEQIMRKVLSPLPGVSRLAVLIFRFTGILTFVIATTAHLPEVRSLPFEPWINAFFMSVALCMCVFEVSLMSMLIAAAPRLGLSFRTRILGLGLGICFLGLMDFLSLVTASMGSKGGAAWGGLSLTSEVVVDGTLLMWITYFVLPDQKRGPLRLTRSSTLMRWNDIVNQLGIGPQPVVELAPSFMTDVEMVVERIMMRNPGHKL
jgi:hypothetical protein